MQAGGQVYASHGDWYYHGWHNGQFFDRLNLTVLLNLSVSQGNVWTSNGNWYYQGNRDGRYVSNLNLSLLLNLTSSGHNGGHGHGGGLLGL